MQNEMFDFEHEHWRDALRHTVKAMGGFEAVGAELFPNKTRKAAGNWLSDCLNEERSAKLDLEEIQGLIALGRSRGVHTAMYELCDSTDYQRPKPATPKSPRTEILEKIAACKDRELQLQRELDRIDNSAAVSGLSSVT